MAIAGEMKQHARIDVAAARAHDEAFQRSEPHARVDGPTLPQRRGRAALAEMQGHGPRPGAEVLQLAREVLVRDPMKPVAAYPVQVLPCLGDGIVSRLVRQVMEEGRIENGDDRQIRETLANAFHHCQGGRIVKRCEGRERFQRVE